MHGGRGERMIRTVLAGLLDDPAHRPCRIVGLQLDEVRGDLGRKPPGLPPVGSRLGVERIEPAVAVALDPPPDRVGGDMGAVAPGDGVVVRLALSRSFSPMPCVPTGRCTRSTMTPYRKSATSWRRSSSELFHGAILVRGAPWPRDRHATH